MNHGTWQEEECKRFLEAQKLYNKDWDKITAYIGTRTKQQVQSHAQKFSKHLEDERRKRDLYNYQLKESDGGIQRLRTRKKKSELVLHHVKSKVKNSHKLNRSLNSLDSSSKESSPKDSNTSIFCSSDSSSSTSFCNNNSTNTNEVLSVKEAALLLLTFKYNNNNRYTNHHIHNSNPLLLLTPIPYSSMYSTFQSNCLSNWNNSCFHCNPSYSY